MVSAIRDPIRAEDLIFRWGGNEFFVIMISMDSKMARQRMCGIEKMLDGILIKGAEIPLTISVSYGFQDFSEMSALEQTIKQADEEMYRQKQSRKDGSKSTRNPVLPSNEHIFVALNC